MLLRINKSGAVLQKLSFYEIKNIKIRISNVKNTGCPIKFVLAVKIIKI